VSQAASHGSLRRVREHVDQFTADDLQRGLVRYDHEDLDMVEENGEDRFEFVVCVEERCADGAVEVRVSAGRPPTRQDAVVSPTVVSRTVVVDRTLGSVMLTAHHLNVACIHCPVPLNIMYFVMSPPRHGHLTHGGTENEALASFSQHDLDLGHVLYRHVDSAHLSDTVQLSAVVRSRDDDVIWSSDVRIEIAIKPNGSEILLSVRGNISVVEGERTFITENQLSIQHGDDVDDVEVVVVRLPVHGRIQVISERELRARTSFLLSEVIILARVNAKGGPGNRPLVSMSKEKVPLHSLAR